MLNAAQIAGLNCLRLVNETTATALAYGIFKTDLPENDPVHVAFVDVGHAHTQVRSRVFMNGWCVLTVQHRGGTGCEAWMLLALCYGVV